MENNSRLFLELIIIFLQMLQNGGTGSNPTDWIHIKRYLTDSVRSGLAAVVKQGHVGQAVAVVHMATALQDLRRETREATIG